MDDMPTFCGAVSSDILFEDIRATTSAKVGDADQYLGDKGSSAIGYGDSRRFNIVADRPGYVMAIATLVPRVDYYQFTGVMHCMVSFRILSCPSIMVLGTRMF